MKTSTRHFHHRTILAAILLMSSLQISAQNVGVGTPNPSEKLEVEGIIYSNDGGIKFPDSTIQTTAAFNAMFESSLENRSYILMQVSNYAEPDEVILLNETLYGIRVVDYMHRYFRSYNASSGVPSSGLQFEPVTIVKAIDRTSPEFFQSIGVAQSISTIELLFLRHAGPALEHYFTVLLEDCYIIDIKPRTEYLGDGNWAHLEEISILFNTITITDQDSGAEFSFSWNGQ